MGIKAISLSFTGSVTLDGHAYINGNTTSLDKFLYTRQYANDIITDYETGSGVITMILDDGGNTNITPAADNDTYTGWVQITYNEWHESDMTVNQYDANESGVVDNAENSEKLGGQLASYYASDADLTSGLALKADKTNVLELDNISVFTPTTDYEPSTKKYVDDSVAAAGGGDMLKSVYDTGDNGIVDNSEKLGNQLPAYYAVRDTVGTTGNLTELDIDGDAVDSGVAVNDTGATTSDIWTGSKITSELSNKLDTSLKGSANGLAELDATGKVPEAQLPTSVIGGVSYQGTWNATTNTPTLTSSVGTKGYYYVVSVAGATNLDGITDWKIGDWAIYDGTAWSKIDNTDSVTSVNTKTGAVVLDPDDLDDTATTNKFTTASDISKLAGIAAGAEVNVNADWNSASGDSQILNKPDLTVYAIKDTDAVTNNLAKIDVNGDSVDSGFVTIDEDTMVSNSATALPTQQSVKAYVDSSTAGSKTCWNYSKDSALSAYEEISAGGTSDHSVENAGWKMVFDGNINKVSVKMDGGATNCSLNLYKNVTGQITSSTTATATSSNTGGGTNNSTIFTFTGVSVVSGDVIRIALTNWSNNPAAVLINENI